MPKRNPRKNLTLKNARVKCRKLAALGARCEIVPMTGKNLGKFEIVDKAPPRRKTTKKKATKKKTTKKKTTKKKTTKKKATKKKATKKKATKR